MEALPAHPVERVHFEVEAPKRLERRAFDQHEHVNLGQHAPLVARRALKAQPRARLRARLRRFHVRASAIDAHAMRVAAHERLLVDAVTDGATLRHGSPTAFSHPQLTQPEKFETPRKLHCNSLQLP